MKILLRLLHARVERANKQDAYATRPTPRRPLMINRLETWQYLIHRDAFTMVYTPIHYFCYVRRSESLLLYRTCVLLRRGIEIECGQGRFR